MIVILCINLKVVILIFFLNRYQYARHYNKVCFQMIENFEFHSTIGALTKVIRAVESLLTLHCTELVIDLK